MGVFVTRKPQILVLDPQLAHEVLVENFRCYKDSLTSSYMQHAKWDKYAKRNPFWAAGVTWRRLRTEAQAGLSANRLKQGYAIWEQSGRKLTNYMAEQVNVHNNILETRDVSKKLYRAYTFWFYNLLMLIMSMDMGLEGIQLLFQMCK